MSDRRKEKKEKEERIEYDYKRITRSLNTINRNEDQTEIQKLISTHLTKGDEYYPVIKKNLSASACDSRHIRNVVHLASEASKRINCASKECNLIQIIKSLKRQHKSKMTRFFVKEFVNNSLRMAPTYEFFYGAIRLEGLEVKQRRKRQKLEMVAANTVRAAERNLDSNEVEKDSTPKEVESIYKKIVDSCKEKTEKPKFFKTIIDSRTFTQTVENLFHTSFLIKEGKISVEGTRGEKPILSCDNDAQARFKPKQQSVLSFYIKDYERYKKKNFKKK